MSSTMLALSAVSAVLVDAGTLKSDVLSRKTNFNLTGATCATWSGDGDVFIGNSAGSVDRFNRKGVPIGTVYSGSEPVVALALKDSRSLLVAVTNYVHIVDTTKSKIVATPIPVTGNIKSIALSHDKELLSITTHNRVYIHALSNSTTVSLNHPAPPITFGVTLFHPSRRSSLIVFCGSQLTIFDVTKPASPLKVIPLGSQSQAVDATFTPGKNLLAVALENGEVCVVDLERDKLIKKLELKQALRTIAVSADGTLFFIGTTSGSVLVYDARTMDKTICSIPIGGAHSILALVSQKRNTPARTATTSKAASSVIGARAPPLSDSNAQRVVPPTRATRKTSAETVPVSKDIKAKFRAVENVNTTTPTKVRKPISRAASARSDIESDATSPSAPAKSPVVARLGPGSPLMTRPEALRVASTNTLRRISAGSSPASSTRSTTVLSRKSDERVSVVGRRAERRISPAYSRITTQRTPSPDLPTEADISMGYQVVYTAVLADHGAAEESDATLGIAPTIAVDLSTPPKASSQVKVHDSGKFKKPPETTPIAPYDSTGFLSPDGCHGTSTPPRRKMGKPAIAGGLQLSPMRSPARLPAPTSTEAQDFLRNVVREAMLEREEEQREELRALHLDMVKMGRTWKNELRSLMQEYVGDFQAIRLENERLRAENERLRRGY